MWCKKILLCILLNSKGMHTDTHSSVSIKTNLRTHLGKVCQQEKQMLVYYPP